jgi:hypothetical protein
MAKHNNWNLAWNQSQEVGEMSIAATTRRRNLATIMLFLEAAREGKHPFGMS